MEKCNEQLALCSTVNICATKTKQDIKQMERICFWRC